MDLEILKQNYAMAKESDSFAVHRKFIQDLLSSNDAEYIWYHYSLLSDRSNLSFYQGIRAAFVKRGEPGQDFLLARASDETDANLNADILLLLGTVRNPTAIPLARKAINGDDTEMRNRGCYVLGWMGEQEDIERLHRVLLDDLVPHVRRAAALACRQLWFRLPNAKGRLLKDLKQALEQEADKEVIVGIVLAVQEIMKRRFGLHEDIEERKITGDVRSAREKCLAALSRLPR